MQPRRSSVICLVACLAAAGAQMAYYYPLLPERMATHFGPSGLPDGWMTKNAFMVTYAGLLAFTTLGFVGIGSRMSAIPNDLINLPNKDYWLASERRASSFAFLQAQMTWFGVATAALLLAMMQLVFQANLSPVTRLGNTAWLYLILYLAYTAVWTVGLIRRFGRRPE